MSTGHINFNKDEFLSANRLLTKYNDIEKKGLINWDTCEGIYYHYKKAVDTTYDAQRTKLMNEIITIPNIHSIRSRCKDPNSLIIKVIEKLYGNRSDKYIGISKDNYHKFLTDLIGIRCIVKYHDDWVNVHKCLNRMFTNDADNYINNPISDHKEDKATKCMVEKPKVYCKKLEEFDFYDGLGSNVFNKEKSQMSYSSIHYIINYGGTYCEIQVRTLFEEAWSEVDHDFVYKEKNSSKKAYLENISKVMS
jgi:ppGpp synthetase/RelA/SpoT-type nucleotidyltranferase